MEIPLNLQKDPERLVKHLEEEEGKKGYTVIFIILSFAIILINRKTKRKWKEI